MGENEKLNRKKAIESKGMQRHLKKELTQNKKPPPYLIWKLNGQKNMAI